MVYSHIANALVEMYRQQITAKKGTRTTSREILSQCICFLHSSYVLKGLNVG